MATQNGLLPTSTGNIATVKATRIPIVMYPLENLSYDFSVS
ncbi:hypothetical protein EBME_1107 [bacterium endosymbiont of Mortierella elongata FMR23-6]|nr:hypothetical protein EBME_1107 [bacterium endosymbiont of Mortierella elongata FMR23-6]